MTQGFAGQRGEELPLGATSQLCDLGQVPYPV